MAFRSHFCNAFRKGQDLLTGLRMKVLDYINFHIPIFNTMNHLRFFQKKFISIISPDYFNLGGIGKIIKKLEKLAVGLQGFLN